MINKQPCKLTRFLMLLLTLGIVECKADDAASNANNPLAAVTALSFHNYSLGDITGVDGDANQSWIRLAKPVPIWGSNLLLRASLPINHFPTARGSSTGIGDLNLLATYVIKTDNPGKSFGIGPVFTLPTAPNDALGSEKWSAGIANVFFNAESPKVQYGYLLTWQASFAGNDDRNDINIAAFQPFLFCQIGKGYYLRSTAVLSYNFETDGYNIPLGLGIGKVIKTEKTTYNFFIEPQVSVWDKGSGQAKWQVFVGLNFQFH